MRHKVVHDYLGVDEDIVWQVVIGDLPKLIEVLDPKTFRILQRAARGATWLPSGSTYAEPVNATDEG